MNNNAYKEIKERIKKKLEKKIKLRNQEKYEFNCMDSAIYPALDLCGGYQEIWLDDNDLIKLVYENIEKFEKKDDEYLIKYHTKKDSRFIIQDFNDQNLTKIVIKYDIKNILFVLDIIFVLYREGWTGSKENDIITKKKNIILPIRSILPGEDQKKEINRCSCIIEDQERFINIITEDEEHEQDISIIIRDYSSFGPMFGLGIWYEHYDYMESYLSDKEIKRMKR